MAEYFELGPDDELPEGLPEELVELIRGITNKIKARAFDSGLAHDFVADEVMPSKEQLEVGPGDLVAVTRPENHMIDGEFTIAEILNPEEHAEEFPDWETRLLNSFVLGKWYSPGDHEGKLGWFPRAKMVKFPEDLWNTMLGWIKGDQPPGAAPPWLVKRYNEALIGMWESNPDKMPKPLTCPKCDSAGVLIHVVKTQIYNYCMGVLVEDVDADPPIWRVVTPYHHEDTFTARWNCSDCGYDEIVPDEYQMYG